MPRHKNKETNIPKTTLVLCALAFVVIVFAGVYNTLNSKYVPNNHALEAFFTCLVVVFLMSAIEKKTEKMEFAQKRMCQVNMMIGLFYTVFFATIPRILVFFAPSYFWTMNMVCLLGITCCHAGLVTKFDEKYEIIYKKDDKIMWMVIVFHVVFTALACLLGYTLPNPNMTIPVQLGYGMLNLVAYVQFCNVFRGQIELNEGEEPEETMEGLSTTVFMTSSKPVVVVDESGDVSDPRLECKICMYPYNQTARIPRMLKECGHTVCEACADNLLKQGPNLICPFCQVVTVVNGPANGLPKNFAIMDMM